MKNHAEQPRSTPRRDAARAPGAGSSQAAMERARDAASKFADEARQRHEQIVRALDELRRRRSSDILDSSVG